MNGSGERNDGRGYCNISTEYVALLLEVRSHRGGEKNVLGIYQQNQSLDIVIGIARVRA